VEVAHDLCEHFVTQQRVAQRRVHHMLRQLPRVTVPALTGVAKNAA